MPAKSGLQLGMIDALLSGLPAMAARFGALVNFICI
jgi:hypothetical protein